MKKSILFVLFSAFAFGQNTELLKSLQNGSFNTPELLARQMIPSFKLANSNHISIRNGEEYYYEYLPGNTSAEDFDAFKNGEYNPERVSIHYLVNGKVFKFNSAKGKCNDILPFWMKDIKPDTEIFEDKGGDFDYENDAENLYYSLNVDVLSGKCEINNMNVNR